MREASLSGMKNKDGCIEVVICLEKKRKKRKKKLNKQLTLFITNLTC